MTEIYKNGDETRVTYYHAHVYYGDDDYTREKSARLREKAWHNWKHKLRMGRFRDQPVGPHPLAMYQIEFAPQIFSEFIPWLMHNRDGLTILVHPGGENAYRDHAWYPLWMGEKLKLNLERLGPNTPKPER